MKKYHRDKWCNFSAVGKSDDFAHDGLTETNRGGDGHRSRCAHADISPVKPRLAPPITTPYQYAAFCNTSNSRGPRLIFQMNYRLLFHFLSRVCIIHHNLLWQLILIRPFLRRGGGGGCRNLDGVHTFPSPQTLIFRETNKETVTGAIYKVINI